MPDIEFGLGLPNSNKVYTAGAAIGILPKIESADSVGHLSAILDAADGAMVARGDLGAELPVQEVSPHTAASQTLVASMSIRFKYVPRHLENLRFHTVAPQMLLASMSVCSINTF